MSKPEATKTAAEAATTTTKTLKRRKDLPSVDYLLKHGDPETAHLPKTWCEIIGYPLVLAMVFALSLFIFHNAPWESMPAREKYSLPKMNRMPHSARVPHLNKKPETTTTTEL